MENHLGITAATLVAVYPQELAALIGKRAQELSDARGGEAGHELEDWLRAEGEVARRQLSLGSEALANHPLQVQWRIAQRAQELSDARGGEAGHELEDWLRAEAEITGKEIVITEPAYPPELQQRIAARARELYDARGGDQAHEVHELEDWLRAEAEVTGKPPGRSPELHNRIMQRAQELSRARSGEAGHELHELHELEDWLRAEAEVTGKEVVITGPAYPPELQQRIAARARELYDARDGDQAHEVHELEDWLRAEAEVTGKPPGRSPELHNRIMQRARELSGARGGEAGHELEDWLQAEAEVMASSAESAGVTGSAARHEPEMSSVELSSEQKTQPEDLPEVTLVIHEGDPSDVTGAQDPLEVLALVTESSYPAEKQNGELPPEFYAVVSPVEPNVLAEDQPRQAAQQPGDFRVEASEVLSEEDAKAGPLGQIEVIEVPLAESASLPEDLHDHVLQTMQEFLASHLPDEPILSDIAVAQSPAPEPAVPILRQTDSVSPPQSQAASQVSAVRNLVKEAVEEPLAAAGTKTDATGLSQAPEATAGQQADAGTTSDQQPGGKVAAA